jgi:hypothetical protein
MEQAAQIELMACIDFRMAHSDVDLIAICLENKANNG